MKKRTVMVLSLLIGLCYLSISYAGPPSNPTPHPNVQHTQTMKAIRWSMMHVADRTGANLSDASFILLDGTDTLNELANLYSNNDRWDSNVMIYVRQVLANENSLAVLVSDNQIPPFIYVPWNSITPPAFDLPNANELIQQRGYIIPIDRDVLELYETDGCKNTGSMGAQGAGVSCGCFSDLGCASCTNCVDPIYQDKLGSYNADTLVITSFSIGNFLPVYGN